MTALELGSRTAEGPDAYRFRTRDGVHAAGSFRGSELLALEHCWDRDLGDLLVVQANYGVLGTVLAERATVTMTESSARAADCCRANLRENRVDATVRLAATPASLDARFDAAVYAPRPYTPLSVGKQRIVDAFDRLRPGGDLFVAGRETDGLDRYRDCLADRATVETVGESDGASLLRATRPERVERERFVEPRRVTASVDGRDLELVTEPGLFSPGGLDDGTRLLLETATVADGDRVLDLCCGYGPVGTYVGLAADCQVVLTDDDARATRCAERTLAANGLDAPVVTADCADGVRDRTFDLALSNPPTHAGSGVLDDLFRGAADVLASDGRLVFVRHRSLDLSAHLAPFESVRTVATGDEHVARAARA